MKKLLCLIVGLLVAGPAFGLTISGKGQVDKFATGNLPTCDATTVQLHGMRVYDVTTNQEKTCDETAAGWVVTATGTIAGATPTLNFDDTGDAGTPDATIYVNCITANDCDMSLGVNSGAALQSTMIEILTETGGTSTAYFGRNAIPGTAWADTQTWVGVTENAGIEINNADPTIVFNDSTMAGTEITNAQIAVACPTGTTAGNNEDCDLDIAVQSAGTPHTIVHIDTTDAGATEIQLGDALNGTPVYTAFAENGNMYMRTAQPFIYFDDRGETTPDVTYDAAVDANCPTDDNCDLSFTVESAADNYVVPLKIDSVGGVTQVNLGVETAGNYISVSEAGRMDTVGTALIMAPTDVVQICGENTTVNNNTVYYGPDTTLVSNTSGFNCDINAAGDTTEATADELAYTSQAVQVTGMTCRNEADSAASISYTLRTAAGATVPSVTCTIDGTDAAAERDCVADIQTTTGIAGGATWAIAAASTSDIGDGNGFICNIQVTY